MIALRQTVENLIQMNSTSSASKDHVCPHCKRVVPKKEIELFGEKRYVQPKCECEVKEIEAELDRLRQRNYKREIEKRFARESLGERFLESTFETFKLRAGTEKPLELARKYVDEFEEWGGESLLIWGDYGNGKSHLAAAVANTLNKKGYIVVFQSVPELFERIRHTFNKDSNESEQEIMNALLKCDLLILDDIGAEKVTDWVQDALFRIIDGRYRRKKPIMYTSNLKPSLLQEKLGGRICDRILEMSLPVENKASSYRKEMAKQRLKRFVSGEA